MTQNTLLAVGEAQGGQKEGVVLRAEIKLKRAKVIGPSDQQALDLRIKKLQPNEKTDGKKNSISRTNFASGQ